MVVAAAAAVCTRVCWSVIVAEVKDQVEVELRRMLHSSILHTVPPSGGPYRQCGQCGQCRWPAATRPTDLAFDRPGGAEARLLTTHTYAECH